MPFPKTPRRITLSMLTIAAITMLPLQQAAAERTQFNITAGPLDQTLNTLSNQLGLTLTYRPKLVEGLVSNGLDGQLNTTEALDHLLEGTNLRYRFIDATTIILERAKDDSSSDGPEVLDAIRVIGTAPQRYKATSASSATAGAEIDLLDTPRSIQVVTEQVIVDQGARDLKDILRNVSGVQTQLAQGGTVDRFILRGVRVDEISQDGVRRSTRDAPIQAANVERVEVVKGPAALLAGQSSGGGVINVITKRPKEESRTIITANADEFGKREVLFDSTGKLTKDGTFLYRLVASTEDSETFREAASEAEIKRDLFAPSLTWNISDNDKLTASFEYTSSELPFDNGTVVVQSADGSLDTADVDESLRFGEDSDIADATQTTFNLEYEHFLENDWKLDVDFNYSSGDSEAQFNSQAFGFTRVNSALPLITDLIQTSLSNPTAANLDAVPENGILGGIPIQNDSDNERINFALRLNGDVDFGTTEHNLTLGTDFSRRELNIDSSQAFISAAAVGLGGILPAGTLLSNFREFDLFNPEFGQVAEFSDQLSNDVTDTQIGVFFNDSIRFNEQWSALVGLRLDYFERDGTTENFIDNIATGNVALDVVAFQAVNTEDDTDQDGETELSPSLGLVYKPLDNISLFTSYSESFQPQFRLNATTGEVIDVDPILSEQIEVGIKGAFLKNKVILGLSYFDITRENIVGDINLLTNVVSFNDEEIRRGVEFDSSIQFAGGLNLNFNASHITEAEIEGGTNAGNTPANVADTTANLSATYEFTGGSLRGLGLGGGANFVGERFVDDANSFELESYTTYDATVFYYIPVSNGAQIRLQAGVRNLTDKETFIAQADSLRIGVGAPRTFFASLSYEF